MPIVIRSNKERCEGTRRTIVNRSGDDVRLSRCVSVMCRHVHGLNGNAANLGCANPVSDKPQAAVKKHCSDKNE
jgi:hypothetical protein